MFSANVVPRPVWLMRSRTLVRNMHAAKSGNKKSPVFSTTNGQLAEGGRPQGLRVFRSCPLITPKAPCSSLQMLAIAQAMAALCA